MDETESLEQRADRLTAAYRRQTWARFAAVFFPVPFTVLLLRFELEPWHYYVAGAAYLIFSAALFHYDTVQSARVDAAVKAAAATQSAAKAQGNRADAGGIP